jgi:hypothetical protein
MLFAPHGLPLASPQRHSQWSQYLPSQGISNENAAPKLKAPRMLSHIPVLSDSNLISRAVWIVYFIFLGIAGGCFPVLLDLHTRPYGKTAVVYSLDENSDNENTVFGPGGTFLREVNMDVFWGKLFQPVLLLFFSTIFQTIYSHVISNGEFEMTTTSVNNFIHSPNSHIGQYHRLYIQHHESANGVFDEAGYLLAACSAVRNATL